MCSRVVYVAEQLTAPPSDEACPRPPVEGNRLPELLSPAGDWECVQAAVEAGAEQLEQMLALGAQWFQVKFLNEPAELIEQAIAKCCRLLCGESRKTRLWKESSLMN